MPDEKVVNQESIDQTPLAEAIASTPEVVAEAQQVQEAQTPPAAIEGETQEQEVQEEARIPYSRFKEKVDEANWLKQQLEIQQRQIQQPQQPTTNPYAGMTAEEERFFRMMDDRAKKIAQEQFQQVNPMLEAGIRELTNMKVQQFRSSHPDIKAGSPEENEIASRIRQGYSSDDAYWAVMGPRGIRVAEEKGKQQVKQQIAAKRQANVESSTSIPANAQTKPKMSFREEMSHNLKLAEEGKL